MSTLTIRNVEEDVMKNLKQQAKRNNRSVEAEVRELLKRNVGRKSPEELLALADKIKAMTPKGIKQTDSAELLREDRDR
jgi:plasmid stability protein